MLREVVGFWASLSIDGDQWQHPVAQALSQRRFWSEIFRHEEFVCTLQWNIISLRPQQLWKHSVWQPRWTERLYSWVSSLNASPLAGRPRWPPWNNPWKLRDVNRKRRIKLNNRAVKQCVVAISCRLSWEQSWSMEVIGYVYSWWASLFGVTIQQLSPQSSYVPGWKNKYQN